MAGFVRVLDDFYPHPLQVREFATKLEYAENTAEAEKLYYKGYLSTADHPFAEAGLELLARRLGRVLRRNAPIGEFRLIFETEGAPADGFRKTWIHFDSSVSQYSGIVYLNPDAQCQGGTAFYRHRELGWDHMPDVASPEMAEACQRYGKTVPEFLSMITDDGFEIDSKWRQLSVVPMRFNRCLVFDSRLFHARLGGFGARQTDGRLTQNFFFDVVM
ncbi:DUF6445 family protein [Microbaculum sp. FT89]|uniref:DUF6445 family protein n=1 Tax=Microbaculum sp. FT89 TaxID=3447298 RepID=UPI003F52B25A